MTNNKNRTEEVVDSLINLLNQRGSNLDPQDRDLMISEITAHTLQVKRETIAEIKKRVSKDKFGEWFFKKERARMRKIIDEIDLDVSDVKILQALDNIQDNE